MKRTRLLVICAAAGLAAAIGGASLAYQSKGPLQASDGLAFSEFAGYEAWENVAPSQVKDGLKIIAANPVMMKAYRQGLPSDGKTFPEGSKIVKIEWSVKPSAESPYPVTVPDRLKSVSFIEKDSKRFPKTHGWAYAQFLYDAGTKTLKPNGAGHECGFACHTGVAKKDYIFTAYPLR